MDPFGRLDSWFDELTILSLSKDRADKMPNELGNYKAPRWAATLFVIILWMGSKFGSRNL
jgi:hypothetical protein